MIHQSNLKRQTSRRCSWHRTTMITTSDIWTKMLGSYESFMIAITRSRHCSKHSPNVHLWCQISRKRCHTIICSLRFICLLWYSIFSFVIEFTRLRIRTLKNTLRTCTKLRSQIFIRHRKNHLTDTDDAEVRSGFWALGIRQRSAAGCFCLRPSVYHIGKNIWL